MMDAIAFAEAAMPALNCDYIVPRWVYTVTSIDQETLTMQVAVRELKTHLSRVLAHARTGETILVTSHNKPVARILGIPPDTTEGLQNAISEGRLSWNGRKPSFKPPVTLSAQTPGVSALVLEDRD
jgi:prevent-host-death family protein